MSPVRSLALAPALVAALAAPAAAAPHVTSAYVYFHTFANKQDRKFNLGTVELVYRTDGGVPEYPETGDPKVVPRLAGNQGDSYAISRTLHCYGASVYADKAGNVNPHTSGRPGHRVRVRIPALGYDKALVVRKQSPDLPRGNRLGCGADPKSGVSLFNLTRTPLLEPGRYFLTADAGPYVSDITWTGWGTSEATGTGTYISDCASCGPKVVEPATITLRTPVACALYATHVYRKGTLTLDPGKAGAKRHDIPTGYPCGRW